MMNRPHLLSEFDQVQAVLNLLTALNYRTRKEEAEIIAVLMPERTGRGPKLEDAARELAAAPGFEQVFFTVLKAIQPFATMVLEIYEFLSQSEVTVARRASRFLVTKENAHVQFNFSMDNFPVELFRVVTQGTASESVVELRAPGLIGDLPIWDGSEAQRAWKAVDPGWDNDFYDDGFHRALSYANRLLTTPDLRRPVEEVVSPLLDRLAAVCLFVIDATDDESQIYGSERSTLLGHEGRTYRVTRILPTAHRVDETSTAVLFRPIRLVDANAPRRVADGIRWTIRGFAESLSVWHDESLRRADRDHWLARRLGRPIDTISPRGYADFVIGLANDYRGRLDVVAPVVSSSVRPTIVEQILEFLALPFWRDRWYLYELWTVVCVLQIASRQWPVELADVTVDRSGTAEWRLPGGSAQKPVARIGGDNGVDCWVQKKTHHPGTGAGLEPDLRLMARTPPYHDVMVIENKDRLTLARGKLEEILGRYVTGTCARSVWITNYEQFPRSWSALENSWPGRQVRIASEFRPGNVPSEFTVDLTAAIGQIMRVEISDDIEATLTWSSAPSDLDLHCWLARGDEWVHVYFGNRGTLGGPPFATLDCDTQAPGSSETIVLRRSNLSALILGVHAFSDDGALSDSGAAVHFRSGEQALSLHVPRGTGRWWEVLRLSDGDAVLDIPGKLTPDMPGPP
jgi:hypothetical protein